MQINTDLDASKYCSEWEKQSRYFQKNSYYFWMVSKLEPNSRIVEIGGGCGLGTIELVLAGHQVICIESNKSCAEAISASLSSHNIRSIIVSSVDEALDELAENQVPILLCDVLGISNDSWNKLSLKAHLNCIVCWLIGTYPDDLANFGVSRPNELREKIHSRLLDVLKSEFAPKAILNTVDRGAVAIEMVSPNKAIESDGSFYYSIQYIPLMEGIATVPNKPLPNGHVHSLVSKIVYK
jgi:hypothetical protein